MPDGKPPTYRWAVTLADSPPFSVDAAYPAIDDGHMLLKDADHKIVFAAASCSGCTFTRAGLAAPEASPAASPVTITGYPIGCACAYSWEFRIGDPIGRMTRSLSWACKADHAEGDRLAVVTADSDGDPAADAPPPAKADAKAQFAPGCCPHGFPPTVRCHQCSPVTA